MSAEKAAAPAPEVKAPKKESKPKKTWYEQLFQDLIIGGTAGAIAKTAMAPVERVKLLLQTMDSNPDVISGKVERYKGIGDCFRRVMAEQGPKAFWRGNLVNCLRYAPQQGSALAFNDLINNKIFPKYDSKTDFWKSFVS
jgi:solute carrier family 25 (adenine nucleotide translocator) protein 4/5/6/31